LSELTINDCHACHHGAESLVIFMHGD
jgi:hypothetical protein